MSDNYFATTSGTATAAPTMPSPATEQAGAGHYGTSNFATAALPALTIEDAPPSTSSPAQDLQTYLDIARHSQHAAVMENALNMALRTQRAMIASTLSNTMPTALKIKSCEIPLLKLFLEFGSHSPQWRALIVSMLADNVETGSGHLTVNRAKQALKELAKRAGAKMLADELRAESNERRLAAITMLGWLKHERAIEPLVAAYDQAGDREKEEIRNTLETHYRPKLAYHFRWRHQAPATIDCALLALLEPA
ncbi:MAG: hypothetical protein KGS72_08285 [Cyanobacteria bacterium REEB67]|nr:hypothetical protein [Cyanobacteria bacterium REEB67]